MPRTPFDPCSNANCGLGLTMVYDTILKLNYETMEVEPSIATSWEWVEDDLLKLTIRDDAVFSNGDPSHSGGRAVLPVPLRL